MTWLMRVPRETVTGMLERIVEVLPLLRMSLESDIGLAVIARGRIRMLRAVKDEHVSSHRHRSNNIRVLRLISRSIDFSFMYNLLSDRKSTLKSCIPPEFYVSYNSDFSHTSPFIIVVGEFCARNRKLNIGYLKIILVSSGSMCSD